MRNRGTNSGLEIVASVHKLAMSPAKIRALPNTDRYVLALIGHIFNDLMALQKLVLVMRPPRSATDVEKDAGVGLTTLMLRMLAGLTWEAINALNRKEVAEGLQKNYFPDTDLKDRWRSAMRFAHGLKWLNEMRNENAFHYPQERDWPELQDPKYDEGAYSIVGTTYGNTFFHWANVLATLPMLHRVNPSDPFEGLGSILDEIGELLNRLTGVLAEAQQRYLHSTICDNGALGPAVSVRCRRLEDVSIPAFYGKKRARKR